MVTLDKSTDPRVKRTRQLLVDAFVALIGEKHNIHSISVQEITERASVNRATFYAHFNDKYGLLEVWMRDKFRRSLMTKLSTNDPIQPATLRLLILAVFDFFALSRHYLRAADQQLGPFFEVATQQELYEFLVKWFKQTDIEETTLLVISWAIFGPAAQWGRGEQSVSLEEMADRILAVVIAGLA